MGGSFKSGLPTGQFQQAVSFWCEPQPPIPSPFSDRDNSLWSFADWSDAVGFWNRAALKSLIVPGGVLLLTVAAIVYSGWLTLALPALSFLYYCAIGGGMLLAWRFHSSRIFLSLLVVFLAQQATGLFGGQGTLIATIVPALAVLVPLNFLLIALMQERGFTLSSVAPVALFLFMQSVAVAVFCSAAEQKPSPAYAHHIATTVALPRYTLCVLAAAVVFLTVRFLITRKPVDSALLWCCAP